MHYPLRRPHSFLTCAVLALILGLSSGSALSAQVAETADSIIESYDAMLKHARAHEEVEGFAEARRAYEKALAYLSRERSGDSMRAASFRGLAGLAAALGGLGLQEETMATIEAAVRIVGEGLVAREDLALLMIAVERLAQRADTAGDPAQGESTRARFESLLDPTRDAALFAQLFHQRGLSAQRRAEPERAVAAFTRAIEMRQKQRDQVGLMWSTLGRSAGHRASARPAEAAVDAADAAMLALAVGDPATERQAVAELIAILWETRVGAAADSGSERESPPPVALATVAAAVAPRFAAVAGSRYIDPCWIPALWLQELATTTDPDPEAWALCLTTLESAARTSGQDAWLAQAALLRAQHPEHELAGSRSRVSPAEWLAIALDAASKADDPILLARVAACDADLAWKAQEIARGDQLFTGFLAICERSGLRGLGMALVHAAMPRDLAMQDQERIARWQSWRSQAANMEETRSLSVSTGTTAKLKSSYDSLPQSSLLATVERLTTDEITKRPRGFTINSVLVKDPILAPMAVDTTWIRLPGVDLLIRGSSVQIASANDAGGAIEQASAPQWDLLARTYALSPGMQLRIFRDGGAEIMRP